MYKNQTYNFKLRTTETMATKIFVNLPVSDLQRSREFWESLGYSFNP
jgi:hypothetical protein